MALGLKGKIIDVSEFKREMSGLIAASDAAYVKSNNRDITNSRTLERTDYTKEDIENITKNGSTAEKKALSVYFFKHNSLYKRIILRVLRGGASKFLFI